MTTKGFTEEEFKKVGTIISKCLYNINNEDIRRSVIIETYTRALAEGDKNVYFVDGASLFADDEWHACTVDGCHPNDLGFYRFAKTLYPTLKIALKY